MSELKITGNPAPVVGKEESYSVNQLLSKSLPTEILNGSKSNPFEYPVEWSVHVLENGRWVLKEENNKTGNKVSYKFTQKSLERKGIRILAKKGDLVARLDVKPQKAESPKIDRIEFLDKNGDKPTQPFAYGQTLKARVHCLHMERRTVYATLWEDDTTGAGHNKANEKNKMKTLPGTVKDGIADIDFVLDPDFAKISDAIKAKGDANEGKTHEYYVTAEILNIKTASANTNVANPSYKDTTAKPTAPAKPIAPKKQTPAQQKGTSKKQEKEKSISDNLIDWWEGLFKIKPIIAPNPIPSTGNNTLKIGKEDKNPKEDKKEKGKCYCNRDFTVEEFTKILHKLRDGEPAVKQGSQYALFGSDNCKLATNDKSIEKFNSQINTIFNKFKINTCIRKIHFLSQVYHETDRFRTTKEYSKNGTYKPYFGRGLMQLTWKSNYEIYAAYSGTKCVENYEIIAENLEKAFDSAGWYWLQGKVLSVGSRWKAPSASPLYVRKHNPNYPKKEISYKKGNETITYGTVDLSLIADDDHVDIISYLVNGGGNGLQERRNYVLSLKNIFNYPLNCITKSQKQENKKDNSIEYDIDKAVKAINENAQSTSISKCAKYVRLAIEAGGLSTEGRPVSAKDYDTFLIKLGFKTIDNSAYSPIKGDIVVIKGFVGTNASHPHGHIEMYNGSKWVSDFKQNDFWPGSDYRNSKPEYKIFRWK